VVIKTVGKDNVERLFAKLRESYPKLKKDRKFNLIPHMDYEKNIGDMKIFLGTNKDESRCEITLLGLKYRKLIPRM